MKNTDDSSSPKGVISLLADWSKAFNLVNFNIVMRILITLKVPEWLLRLMISYLENRKMVWVLLLYEGYDCWLSPRYPDWLYSIYPVH